jgi:DinB family
MNYWMDYEVKRIRGEAPKYPDHAAKSWSPNNAPGGEQEWMKGVSQFGELLGRFVVLAEGKPEELAREVGATHPDHAQRASTMRDVLWQTLVHNSYHVGQIAMLRRCLGAWPPRLLVWQTGVRSLSSAERRSAWLPARCLAVVVSRFCSIP